MIIDQFFISNREARTENVRKTVSSDKTIRSIVKAISWRIVGTIDTVTISWFITHQIAMALTIGSIELITKMLLYFAHERAWNIIKWGKK